MKQVSNNAEASAEAGDLCSRTAQGTRDRAVRDTLARMQRHPRFRASTAKKIKSLS